VEGERGHGALWGQAERFRLKGIGHMTKSVQTDEM
jgi:hypothetical protein